jgi:hypothetical protein
MTVFHNKNLIKAFLEKKNKGRKNGGKFWHQNRYQNLILVSVADTEIDSLFGANVKNHMYKYF